MRDRFPRLFKVLDLSRAFILTVLFIWGWVLALGLVCYLTLGWFL